MRPDNPKPRRPSDCIAGRFAELAVWLSCTSPLPPPEHRILEYCRETWGVSKRVAHRYLSHARHLLNTAAHRDVCTIRGEQYLRLEAIARDKDVAPRDRVRAERAIADLCGTNAPKQVQLAVAHVEAAQAAKAIAYADIVALEQRLAGTIDIPSTSLPAPQEPAALPPVPSAPIDVEQVPSREQKGLLGD